MKNKKQNMMNKKQKFEKVYNNIIIEIAKKIALRMDKMDSFLANANNAKKSATKSNKMGIPPVSSQHTKYKIQKTKSNLSVCR